jgi:hypothetical protein
MKINDRGAIEIVLEFQVDDIITMLAAEERGEDVPFGDALWSDMEYLRDDQADYLEGELRSFYEDVQSGEYEHCGINPVDVSADEDEEWEDDDE